MVKIANDTPKELLNLGKRLKFDGNREAVGKKCLELNKIARKYVSPRKTKITYMDFDMDAKFQPLTNLISKYDFNALGNVARSIGLTYIKNYLQSNGFLK